MSGSVSDRQDCFTRTDHTVIIPEVQPHQTYTPTSRRQFTAEELRGAKAVRSKSNCSLGFRSGLATHVSDWCQLFNTIQGGSKQGTGIKPLGVNNNKNVKGTSIGKRAAKYRIQLNFTSTECGSPQHQLVNLWRYNRLALFSRKKGRAS